MIYKQSGNPRIAEDYHQKSSDISRQDMGGKIVHLKEESQINKTEIKKQKNLRNYAIIFAILALA
ncbi:MAG: hypothetical protein ACQER7_13325, partial [Bacteroidota bacterium]